MPQIGANFQFTSRQPNFERDQFDTIAHMKACTICDEGHKCYCLENQKTYEFTSVDASGNAIQPNETTGYWHEFSSGGSGDITGATIGSGASEQTVTKVGSILKFPAYPTVPITGIKDSNGNDLTPVGGKVTLPAASTASITKIKVDGESSDLPINDGRVVIPQPPVKGIQTSSGTTLNPDPNSGIVILPPIPDASTANTMLYSDAGSYDSGSIGKALKDARDDIKTMYGDLHPVEQQDHTPVSPTTVDLDNYDETDDSFTYSDDTVYVYGVSNTSKIVYNDNGTDYAVFKVNDVDKYIRYEITENEGTITYTCEDVYTLNDLPSEARNLFEISKYAAVKIITGTKTDYFYKGRYSVFVDSDNRPMQNDFYEATENNTTVNYALFKSNNNGNLYLYKLYTSFYKFQSKITSTDANYSTLDVHFGTTIARKIEYDDTNSQLGTQSNPVDNMQVAVEAIKNHCDTLLALEADWTNQVALLNRANINFGISDLQEFAAANHYEAGEYVLYNNNIYKFTTNHDGDWNDNHAARTSIVNEMILQSFGDIEHISFKVSTTAGALPSSTLSELRLEVTYSDDNNILSVTHQQLPSALTLSFDVDGYAVFTCPMGLFYTTQIVQVSGSIVLNQYNTPQIIKRQARISWRTIGENLIATYDTNVSGIFIVDRDGIEYPSTDFVGDNATWTFDQDEAIKFKWIYFRDNNLNTNNGKFAIAIEEIIAGYPSKQFGPASNEAYTGDQQYDGKTRTQHLYNNYPVLRNTSYAVGWAMSQHSVIAGNEYQGFVPSVQQLTRILNNYQLINSILDVIRPTSVWTGNTQRLVMSYIWSCTNAPYAHSMQCINSSGAIGSTKKESQSKVITCYSYE